MNTPAFWLAIIVGVTSALAGSSALGALTTLFGEHGSQMIAAASSLLTVILSIPLAALTTQAQMARTISTPGNDVVVKVGPNAPASLRADAENTLIENIDKK